MQPVENYLSKHSLKPYHLRCKRTDNQYQAVKDMVVEFWNDHRYMSMSWAANRLGISTHKFKLMIDPSYAERYRKKRLYDMAVNDGLRREILQYISGGNNCFSVLMTLTKVERHVLKGSLTMLLRVEAIKEVGGKYFLHKFNK